MAQFKKARVSQSINNFEYKWFTTLATRSYKTNKPNTKKHEKQVYKLSKAYSNLPYQEE